MAANYRKLSCLVLIFLGLSLNVNATLTTNFYSASCPNIECIIKEGIEEAIKKEPRVGASLLRLHFHDCFVNGCDASVLLDDTPTFKSEKTAIPNNGSIRGFEVIDNIKAKLESACPGVVSCADILATAARDSVVYYGGPSWPVGFGRRDARTANQSLANANLPPPFLNLTGTTGLIQNFKNQGLSFQDMVALSGAHTVGFAQCSSYRGHIYNDTNIDPSFAKSLQATCPRLTGNNSTLAPEDRQTPYGFDNKYYQNLLVKKGLLHSDQELYNANLADSLVQQYVNDQNRFFKDFAEGMVKMGRIKLLTGTNGEIRLNCHKLN